MTPLSHPDGRLLIAKWRQQADQLEALLTAAVPVEEEAVTACGLTRAALHKATARLDREALVDRCAHVRKGATPRGVMCRDCRREWVGEEGERVWKAMVYYGQDETQTEVASPGPVAGAAIVGMELVPPTTSGLSDNGPAERALAVAGAVLGVCECGHGEGFHLYNHAGELKRRLDCFSCACETYRPRTPVAGAVPAPQWQPPKDEVK